MTAEGEGDDRARRIADVVRGYGAQDGGGALSRSELRRGRGGTEALDTSLVD
jgi:hypothetical protein